MPDVFEAIADPTRRAILERLCARRPASLSELAASLPMSRQAVAKHLRVLEGARLVRRHARGRERIHVVDTAPLGQLARWHAAFDATREEGSAGTDTNGNPLEPILHASGVVVLDGGLATALEAGGEVLDSSLWSARLLLDDPTAIQAVHRAYLEAGADCITTASYQASFAGFAEAGLTDADTVAALRRSSELALAARDAFVAAGRALDGTSDEADPVRPLVAASVGPYGAHLADGSEYDGRYGVSRATLDEFHRRRFDVLADTAVDLLACETIPSRMEVEVILDIVGDHPSAWAWIAFTCADGARLRDGSDFTEAVAACNGHPRVAAVGVNCTHPRYVAELTSRARSVTDLPIVVYANSGEDFDPETRRWRKPGRVGRGGGTWEGRRDPWLAGCRDSLAAGARVVGGCCRIGPEGIAQLRLALRGGDWSLDAFPER